MSELRSTLQSRSNAPRRTRPRVTSLLLFAAAGVLLGRYMLPDVAAIGDPVSHPRAITPRGELSAAENTTISLFERCSPSVVYIRRIEVRRNVFSLNAQAVEAGTGSGFIWDEDGHVVTNFHVIYGTDAALVTLYDNSTYEAEVVGAYPDKDIAVLKIKAPRALLKPVQIGTSHDLKVGQNVYAIGNPFGLDYTLTTGVVSALNREIQSLSRRTIQGVIQSDAAINPGNSGGPLLDSAGRLIGINTAIYSPSGSSAGIGFSVPVDVVYSVVSQLIEFGHVVRPGLGVNLAPDETARRIGIKGVMITNVLPDSAAERAGLRGMTQKDRRWIPGDIVLEVGGMATPTFDKFATALEQFEVGDTVELKVQRGEGIVAVKVTLQEIQ